MNIVLINPNTDVDEMREMYVWHENIGLALIKAKLAKHGYNSEIIDLRVHKQNESEVANTLSKKNANLVGISVNFATLQSAIRIVELFRSVDYSNCIIALGGEHATYLDEEILSEYATIDCIVRGEGESTFFELANSISSGASYREVRGISYFDRFKQRIIRNQDALPIANINQLPHAHRDISTYSLKHNIPTEIGILAQRGCPFPCSFCNANRFLGNETTSLRYRDPVNVVNEMKNISPLFDGRLALLRFYDATFVTKAVNSRRWVDEFCNELENQGVCLPFDAFIRVDSFDWQDAEDLILLKRLKDSGMVSTYLGIEAGDNATLSFYNKKTSSNLNVIAYSTLKKYGMNGSTNGCMTFHQDITLQQLISCLELYKELELCSLWNITSRSETLPGIKLNDITRQKIRGTSWDVYNYSFSNDDTNMLYSHLNRLKARYSIHRFEDHLCRTLRDRLRVFSFYEGLSDKEIDINEDIHNIQQTTYNYLHIIIETIRKEGSLEVPITKKITNNYVYYMSEALKALQYKYTDLLKINGYYRFSSPKLKRPIRYARLVDIRV